MKKEFDFDDIGKRRPIVYLKVSLTRCSVRCRSVLAAISRQGIAYG